MEWRRVCSASALPLLIPSPSGGRRRPRPPGAEPGGPDPTTGQGCGELGPICNALIQYLSSSAVHFLRGWFLSILQASNLCLNLIMLVINILGAELKRIGKAKNICARMQFGEY